MPRSWASWLSACAVLFCCAVPATAAQPTTRVFAMQPKLDLAWMESRDSFHDKMFGLFDASLRGAGKPLIQAGADDAASHLRPDGRNLVVWPEDIGLWSAFTGPRGASARASGSLVGAVATLLTDYAAPMSWYAQKYPDVASRFPQVRLLALALTDTFNRVAVETFSEMAAKHGVWLEAGLDIAQDWQVVCVTDEHPPQQPCTEQNPGKVMALGDPGEPARGYAYEATSPDVSNMALLFGPDGKLVSKQVKNYLTPIEVGQAEGQLAALDLVPGAVDGGLGAVETPVGTLGFVTSKDAWMPDVVDRLEADGVDLLLQPEFFVGDLAAPTGMWAADTLKASGISDLQRHPGFTAMALPSAVGNVFDFSADQQSHIAARAAKPRGGEWLIGQPPTPELVGVTPWVVPDPARKGEPVAERRRRLGEAGLKLAPGSGEACPDPAKPGPCEGGHVEGVLWRDVPVGRAPYRRFDARRLRTRFAAARPLGRRRVPERNAAVAVSGRKVVVAFEQQRGAGDRVMVAMSRDGGRHWINGVEAAPGEAGDQRWPAVALDRAGRVTLAWTASGAGSGARGGSDASERSNNSAKGGGAARGRARGRARGAARGSASASGPPRVVFTQGRAGSGGSLRFRAPRPIDPDAPDGVAQWKPALAQGGKGVVHAAFVDARARSADGDLPQAGVFYTRIRRGAAERARRMDEGPPDQLAAKLDNAWSPRLVARGKQVLLTWIDFVHYDWDVLSRLSRDGGATFAEQVVWNREPKDVEDLSDSPQPLLTRAGPLVAWTDFHKRDSVERVHPLYDTYLARPGAEPLQVDPFGGRQVSTYWPSACAAGRDVIVAFQDSATGVARIRVTRVRGGARRGRALRVNDTRKAAYRPSLACGRGRAVVAWEDARSGFPRIYAAAAPLKRVR